MNDIVDSADTANDTEKPKHKRWKDAISRTKNKFKKDAHTSPEDFRLSDDVNDFLAAGRKPAATVTTRQVVDAFSPSDSFTRLAPGPQDHVSPASRGVNAPRLDISQSQRWPNAQPLNTNLRSRSDDLLSPEYTTRHEYGRSHSLNSALAKRRSKPRGLSVAFLNAPPTIIGEGGDEAEAPPVEISRAKQRSRSLSPYVNRPASAQSSGSDNHSPIKRKPVGPPSPPPPTILQRNVEREDDIFQPKAFRRVQTGFDQQQQQQQPPPNSPGTTEPLEMQLERALRLDEGHSFNDPFTDLRAQHKTVSLQPHGQRERDHSNIVVQGSQLADEKGIYEVSPQLQPSPDLQQSCETSHRPLPPKMPNFYAEISQQSSRQPIASEKQPVVYQVQESALRLSPQSQAQTRGQIVSGPMHRPGHAMGPIRVEQQPPEGWI